VRARRRGGEAPEGVQELPHAAEPRRLRRRRRGAVVEGAGLRVPQAQLRLLLQRRQARDGGVAVGARQDEGGQGTTPYSCSSVRNAHRDAFGIPSESQLLTRAPFVFLLS